LDELRLGRIERIDLLVLKNEKGEEYKRVLVHFQEWFWNEDAQEVRRKLISGKEIKIVYDGPWFWKVSANNWQPSDASAAAPAARSVQRPRIEFDDEDDRRPRYQEDRRPRHQEDRNRNEARRPCHEDRKPRQEDRRPHHEDRRSHHEPKAPALKPKALPIAPALKQKPLAPALKPKALPIAPTLKEEVSAPAPTYTSMPIPVKSRQLKKKPVAEKKAKPALELEEGELVEVDGVTVSAEELQELDDLYGDLNI
jgi:hypothetical protein